MLCARLSVCGRFLEAHRGGRQNKEKMKRAHAKAKKAIAEVGELLLCCA